MMKQRTYPTCRLRLESGLVALLMFLIAGFECTLHAQRYSDSRWDNRFGAQGIEAQVPAKFTAAQPAVQCIGSDGGDIVIGGLFGSVSNNIVRWNRSTRTWENLSDGLDSVVKSIVVNNDTIYAAGAFQFSGAKRLQNIAAFSKKSQMWSPLSEGITGSINALCVFRGEVYAAGSFAAAGIAACRNIARWDGTEWNSLGRGVANGANGEVSSMTVYQDKLIICGIFHDVGGDTSLRRVAVWDGSAWSAPPGDLWFNALRIPGIRTLSLHAHDSVLAIAGRFDSVSVGNTTIAATNLIVYDGHVWFAPLVTMDSLKGGLTQVCVSAHDVYCGGSALRSLNNSLTNGIARWNRTTQRWYSLGSGLNVDSGSIKLTTLFNLGGSVFCGGTFRTAGTSLVTNIAEFDESSGEWSGLGIGPCMGLDGKCVLANLPTGLTAAGTFSHSGSNTVRGIALWNGSAWTSLGPGIVGGFRPRTGQRTSPPWESPLINCIAWYQNAYYIGGDFTGAGSLTTSCIVGYDGSTVFTVGGGMVGSTDWDRFNVSALTVFNNELYAVGSFIKVASQPDSMLSIARWDGTSWHRVSNGIASAGFYSVIEAFCPDSHGGFFVGGYFKMVDSIACSSLLHWSNNSWEAVGFEPDDGYSHIVCIAQSGSDLYVAGNFDRHGGQMCNGIARWDGHQWHSLQGGMVNGYSINAMVVKGRELYVGGKFNAIGNIAARNVAVWDMVKEEWHALGSGVDNAVSSMVVVNDTVFISGAFRSAGTRSSSYVAAWLPASVTEVEETEGLNISPLCVTPNPAYDRMLITIPATKDVGSIDQLEICDLFGCRVQVCPINESISNINSATHQQCDVSGLPNGTYVVRARSSRTCLCALFVVAH